MEIHPVGAAVFHAGDRQTDRQTDITKLIVAFRDFANVSKKVKLSLHVRTRGVYAVRLSLGAWWTLLVNFMPQEL
jgi:nitrogen fixation protein FixH